MASQVPPIVLGKELPICTTNFKAAPRQKIIKKPKLDPVNDGENNEFVRPEIPCRKVEIVPPMKRISEVYSQGIQTESVQYVSVGTQTDPEASTNRENTQLMHNLNRHKFIKRHMDEMIELTTHELIHMPIPKPHDMIRPRMNIGLTKSAAIKFRERRKKMEQSEKTEL